MSIDRDQVLETAALANLQLTSEEADVFASQLSTILDYVSQLEELDTSDVPPMSHSTLGEAASHPWREDAARPSLGSDVATVNAPEGQAGFFTVPNVIAHARRRPTGEGGHDA